jgi:lysozyme
VTVKKTAATICGSGAIAACVAFLPGWEGMDKVAKRDMIGTGHPITYCNGLTTADGKVQIGQHFTRAECDKALAGALPKYWAKIEPCIEVELPDKTAAALLDAAWNAGPGRVCRSPMLAQMNAGNLRAGCNAFAGWIIRSDGKVRAGLVDRRNGEDHGDHRLSEKGLCLQGVAEGVSTGNPFTHAAQTINARLPAPKPAAELTPESPGALAVNARRAAHGVKPQPPKPAPVKPWYWWILK